MSGKLYSTNLKKIYNRSALDIDFFFFNFPIKAIKVLYSVGPSNPYIFNLLQSTSFLHFLKPIGNSLTRRFFQLLYRIEKSLQAHHSDFDTHHDSIVKSVEITVMHLKSFSFSDEDSANFRRKKA
jgi:hypothetical protein